MSKMSTVASELLIVALGFGCLGITGLLASPAHADEQEVLAADSVVLREELHASDSISVQGTVFKYTFTPVEPGDDAKSGLSSVPTGAVWGNDDVVVLTSKEQTGDVQTIEETLALPDVSAFKHAGIYAWTVKQVLVDAGKMFPVEPGAGTGFIFDEKLKDFSVAKAEYKVRLYVVNDPATGNLKYADKQVTVERLVGNPENGDLDDLKVNPVSKTITDEETGESRIVPSQFYFYNSLVAVRDLTVQNTVEGDLANYNYKFPIKIVGKLPDSVPADATFQVKEGHGGENVLTLDKLAYADQVITAVNGTLELETELAHGDYITIKDLPVGTTYTVETQQPKDGNNIYDHRADWRYSSGSTNDGYTTKVTSNPVEQGSYNKTGGEGKVYPGTLAITANDRSAVGNGLDDELGEFTNESGNVLVLTHVLSEDSVSPTGLAVHYGPYAALVLVAAVGGCGLYAKRRSREKE